MFYERFLALCVEKGIAPSAAATQAGFNRGTVSVWKKKFIAGVDVRPDKDMLDKICKFFNCSETWLLGIDEKEKKPAPDDGSERNYGDSVLMDAFKRADESTQEAILLLLKLK